MRFFYLILLLMPVALAAEGPKPLDRADIAFQMAQTLQNSEAAQAVQQIALRLALKQDGSEVLALANRNLKEDIAAVRRDPGLNDAERRQRLEALDTELLVNSRALAEAFPGYLDIVAPDPLTISEAQAALAADEALIQFHQGEHWLTIWIISQSGVIWHRVPMSQEEAANHISRYRAGMGLDGTVRAGVPLAQAGGTLPKPIFDFNLSITLYQWLFAPYKAQMNDYAHLLIVPDKAWIGLPFATLLTDAAMADQQSTTDNLRNASWMMNDHAITVLPSAVNLRARQGATQQGHPATLLAVGDPVFTGVEQPSDVVRSAALGAIDVSALVRLPGTRREVRAIAGQFGPDRSQVLLGAEATEHAVRTATMAEKDVIVFATHGLIAGELQGLSEPALALTPPAGLAVGDRPTENDGLLTASEIAGLTLSSRWVVLSACNTAAGNGEGAEGLSGLARAFFAAGAQTLLVSHWPVRDDAAARLTSDAFSLLEKQGDMRRAEAMRLSMKGMLHDTSDSTFAHPATWAPFFLVGD